MQSDWLKRVQYWVYCTLDLNIVPFDKIKQQHLIPAEQKERRVLIEIKSTITY